MFEKILIAHEGDQLSTGNAATKLNCAVANTQAAMKTRS
jgi:hypothetical protein